jgi:superfamily II DNA/RNA helicase
VLSELPPRTIEMVRIAPTDEQLVLHKAHKRVVASIVTKRFISEMDLLRLRTALLMMRMAADSTILCDKLEPGYSSKLERLDELFGRVAAEPDRKVVLFSEWTSMLDLIEPMLGRHQLGFVRLDGSVPQKQRHALVHQFQEDPACRFFIATNAGSTGLNLQVANTVINVDLPWNPAVLEQRIARAHRMGQERPVQVFVLVTEGTIEEDLLQTLGAKKDLALAALDAESDVDTVDMQTGMEELRRRLEALLGARPEAPVDESEKVRVCAETDRLARRERMASAAGQMLTAALAMLGEIVPQAPSSAAADRLASAFESSLRECVDTDDKGQLRLTVTLPGHGENGSGVGLAALARSLAQITSLNTAAMPSA